MALCLQVLLYKQTDSRSCAGTLLIESLGTAHLIFVILNCDMNCADVPLHYCGPCSNDNRGTTGVFLCIAALKKYSLDSVMLKIPLLLCFSHYLSDSFSYHKALPFH